MNKLAKMYDKLYEKNYPQKSIRFEPELIEKIEKLAEESERDFSKQVKYMLKKYIEMIESK